LVENLEQPPVSVPASVEAPSIEIGLLWHSVRSGNLGVGALTIGDMALASGVARELGLNPRFTILSMRDGDTPPFTDSSVKVHVIDTKSLLAGGYWKELGHLDCVLDIGAGDSFADIYGAKRFAFLWLSKLLSIARRVPLVLAPQTIGPFTRQPYKALARFVMERSEVVVARDDKSLDIAHSLAPKARSVRSVDVAFVMPFKDQSHLRGGDKLRVGVNTSGLLFHEAESRRNHFGLSYDYARFTRQLIETLLARGDAEVHLVTHATSHGMPQDDDSRLADRLAKEYPKAIRVPNFPHPADAKSYISSLDLLVAGRMHACIAAYSSRTPAIPAAYSRKFSGLFGMLGYDWMIPVAGMDEDQAVAFVLNALERRPDISADIERGLSLVEEKLDIYRDALRSLFSKIKGAHA